VGGTEIASQKELWRISGVFWRFLIVMVERNIGQNLNGFLQVLALFAKK
jgi:hypothetical protein